MAGILYLCATPIGNLEDMTFRAVRILKEADLIAAEDTRNSIRLLNHFEIKNKLTSYHEYNKYEKAAFLVKEMLAGKNVALITDAGTPGISDPGEELVRQCWEAGIEVTAVPGASAGINALILSGLPTRRFVFEGFLAHDHKERKEALARLQKETRTMILYEAPHRLRQTLHLLRDVFGDDRRITVVKELTKRHEKKRQGTLAEMEAFYESTQPRGEYVLIIAGKDPKEIARERQDQWKTMSVREHVAYYEKKGISHKEAMKQAARDRGVGKRDIYKSLLEENAEEKRGEDYE